MANELSTPGAFIDVIRKGNYPIILDVELKDTVSSIEVEAFWKWVFAKLLSQE